jgi:endonuclease/exonuclease/phosphatase (EEP) superfamily protein YafD
MTLQDQTIELSAHILCHRSNRPIFIPGNLQLDGVGQYLQSLESPKLLLGDLNITMWSPYYQQLTRKTGLKNARDGFGILPSWPTSSHRRPFLNGLISMLAIPIDHCLLSPDLSVLAIPNWPRYWL